MGNVSDRLVRVPNSEVWIDRTAVVAVARLKDSHLDDRRPTDTNLDPDRPIVSMVNFQIRLIDGKAVNVQHHDRDSIRDFLNSIGVTWEA